MVTQRMTSLSAEDHFVYIRLAFFVRIKKLLRFSRNACIFKFHYNGEGAFLKLNFLSKIRRNLIMPGILCLLSV